MAQMPQTIEIKMGKNIVLLQSLISTIAEICELIPEWQQFELDPLIEEAQSTIQEMIERGQRE